MNEEDRTFTHAIYNAVTHWAAFMVTFGLLLSMGVVVTTAPKLTGMRFAFIASAVGAMLLASIYFLQRILTFGGRIQSGLSSSYLRAVWLFGLDWRWSLLLGGVASVAVAVGDWLVLVY